jgi:hypothetical protein
MRKNKFILLILFLISVYSINLSLAQNNKERIGYDDITKEGVNYYNYSDKEKVNFEVCILGNIRNPGKYLIPAGTTFIDIFSLSGGSTIDAKLADIRIIRLKNDTLNIKEDKVIILNYSDLLSDEKIQNPRKQNPLLYPGDVILIPGITKSTFRENMSIILSSVSVLTSIAVLLITIFRK